MRDRLEAAAEALGLRLDGAAHDRIAKLCGLWRTHGRAINLTGARDDVELAEHVIDAFVVVACAGVGDGPPVDWLDVGSGGGFPSLIVAAVTNAAITLLEPRQRRAAFLELALATIGNKSVVVRARLGDPTWAKYAAEREKKLGEARFWMASARAVFAPDAWLALGDNLVVPGGWVLVHGRPGVVTVGGRSADRVVEHGRTRIEGFRCRFDAESHA
jgi:16S rRNA (guanine527-N7)-methyltransferase